MAGDKNSKTFVILPNLSTELTCYIDRLLTNKYIAI
nr:MAG TPA: hypothetical protein [Caudoviricetes sp.]